jgi:hypothetical protein
MLSDGNVMQRISPTFVGRMCLILVCPRSAQVQNFCREKFVPTLPCCQTKGCKVRS